MFILAKTAKSKAGSQHPPYDKSIHIEGADLATLDGDSSLSEVRAISVTIRTAAFLHEFIQ